MTVTMTTNLTYYGLHNNHHQSFWSYSSQPLKLSHHQLFNLHPIGSDFILIIHKIVHTYLIIMLNSQATCVSTHVAASQWILPVTTCVYVCARVCLCT